MSAATASAAYAATVNALRASGTLVRLEPRAFEHLVRKAAEPLVVRAPAGFLGNSFSYMMPYKGLTFYTKSKIALDLPRTVELIEAASIWIPG